MAKKRTPAPVAPAGFRHRIIDHRRIKASEIKPHPACPNNLYLVKYEQGPWFEP